MDEPKAAAAGETTNKPRAKDRKGRLRPDSYDSLERKMTGNTTKYEDKIRSTVDKLIVSKDDMDASQRERITQSRCVILNSEFH